MASDTYSPGVVLGSTDWTGGVAPSGGTHTGKTLITMVSGATFQVAHNLAEVRRKLDAHAVPPPSRGHTVYVAFDRPGVAIPAILDVSRIAKVQSLA